MLSRVAIVSSNQKLSISFLFKYDTYMLGTFNEYQSLSYVMHSKGKFVQLK